jgi:uncharacterized membrane protein
VLLVDLLVATLVLFPPAADEIWFAVAGGSAFDPSDLRIPLLAVALVTLVIRRPPLRLLADVWSKLAWLAAGALAMGALTMFLSWHLAIDGGAALSRLTYGAGAVPLVAIVAALARHWTGAPWGESWFVRQAARVAQLWCGALERAPARTLWSAAAAVGVLFFWVALTRHRAFYSHGFDLGLFTNAMWNLTHGYGYVSSFKGGINLFADHQSPLFWALAPLYWALPRAETLLFAQAFGLAAGGPALFYLARAHFGRGHWAGAALPWLYWCYLPLRKANIFEFHPEVFMLPLFLWAFAAFASERRAVKALGLLALAAALGAKESAAVVAVGIGIAWALVSGAGAWRRAWPGIALAAAGTALFFFDVKVVPRFFGGDYAYLGMYQRFGGGVADVLLAPFTQPALFFSQILDYERLNFLFWTLAPLGFLPLLAWRAMLAALPPYLMLFLSEGDQRVRIVYHYGIEPASALFWALPFGLAAAAARFGWTRTGLWLLFWALACLDPSEASWSRLYQLTPHKQWLQAEALPCIAAGVPLAATGSLVPHLADRHWISAPDALRQQPSGEPVGCVVTDVRLDNWPLNRPDIDQIVARLPEAGYREAYICRSFSVHALPGAECLRCVPRCAAPTRATAAGSPYPDPQPPSGASSKQP